MPALVVAMAGKPASSTMRALATSHAFGSSSTSLARVHGAKRFRFCALLEICHRH